MGIQTRLKLIALDLDGTSVQPSGEIGPRLLKAVTDAQARGVHVLLATGRMVQSARRYWLDLKLNPGPLIAYNGGQAVTMPDESVIFRHGLSSEAAHFVVQKALEYDLLAQVYIGDEMWISREDSRARHYIESNHIPAWVRSGDEIFDWPQAPIKILLQADSTTLDQFRPVIEAHASDFNYRVFKSQQDYLEIVQQGVGKGPALQEVCQSLGIVSSQVMAIGDAENDIDMLRWCGFGVAMGQAPASVKRVARFVTDPIEEDGAALAIEKWVLEAPSLKA